MVRNTLASTWTSKPLLFPFCRGQKCGPNRPKRLEIGPTPRVLRPKAIDLIRGLLKSSFAVGSSQNCLASRCSQGLVALLAAWERCLALEEPQRHGCLHRFVNSTAFGMVSGAVILLNAIFIFYTTDLEMQNIDSPFDLDSRVQIAELFLASFYVVELFLKLLVHRLFFFWNSEMSWNCFDTMRLGLKRPLESNFPYLDSLYI